MQENLYMLTMNAELWSSFGRYHLASKAVVSKWHHVFIYRWVRNNVITWAHYNDEIQRKYNSEDKPKESLKYNRSRRPELLIIITILVECTSEESYKMKPHQN